MTDNVKTGSQSTQSADSPSIEQNIASAQAALEELTPRIKEAIDKPKHAGGRPSKAELAQPVQDILDRAAPAAALLLSYHVSKKKGYAILKPSLQRACEYVIDHALGKAKQKIEHSGGIMTYGQLAKSAESLASKSRPFLADTEELSAKSLSAEDSN